MKNDYWDPVKKRISTRLDYSLALKNHINFICGSDISETRLYNSQFTKFSPTYCIEENPLFLPYKETHHIPKSYFFEHWAYDKHLNPILIADHYKPVLKGYKDHSELPVYPFKAVFPSEHMKGNYYYMGMLNPHYGHFIQEGVTRFWLALKKPSLVNKNTKFVYHVFENFNEQQKNAFLNSNMMQYLAVLGINSDNIVFIKKPTTFEHIIIPESGISISDGNCYLTDEARLVWLHLNKMMAGYENKNSIVSSKRVYLSRRAVKAPIQGRILLNEDEVESYFRSIGFEIIVPEDLSQIDMQKALSTTNFIAGSPGSGLQNSFFIPNPAKTLGITCLPIMKINPGINHQVNTDLICGHKTYGYNTSTNNIFQKNNSIEWKVSINNLDKCLATVL
ncbi:DUF563 domain-containing protein [Pseudoalteromonas sp. SR43-5]|uniref:glycosyltransferase family 61 protein n=1 Tax=Pseudoalteromonas sp. SR43-5 TaxID=2760941 RepID=UPI0015F83F65|nr:glycosyltransferase family 61 protein [Pseudoalteromonas sp. SR43-5]MBB1304066.1 glycosyltransferase family 61 protein [Pseudoalteromonas sp. SR43-5]